MTRILFVRSIFGIADYSFFLISGNRIRAFDSKYITKVLDLSFGKDTKATYRIVIYIHSKEREGRPI